MRFIIIITKILDIRSTLYKNYIYRNNNKFRRVLEVYSPI